MQEIIIYFEQFQRLTDADKKAILATCSLRNVDKRELLEDFGSTSKILYFIKSGTARTFYYKDGTDVTEYFALEGDLVTRVKSMLTQEPSLKAIEMIEEGEVIMINTLSFFDLFDAFPNIERLYRILLQNAYIETVDRLESIQFKSARERYEALINEDDLIQKVPLKYLASYLGITPESLSRIRASLQKKPF